MQKNGFIFLVAFLGLAVAKEQISLWTYNDNLSGDDFLSFGLGSELHFPVFYVGASLNGVTSKQFGYRYDLAELKVGYKRARGNFWMDLSLGAFRKGDVGGEQIQNAFHQSISIGGVDLPYDSTQNALALYGNLKKGFMEYSWLKSGAELRICPALVSSRATPYLEAEWHLNPLFVRANLGWRQLLTRARHYSELERSGLLVQAQMMLNLAWDASLIAGVQYVPTRGYEASQTRATSIPGWRTNSWIGLSWGLLPHFQETTSSL